MSVSTLVLIGWAALVPVMVALWFVQRRIRDAGVVDVAWAGGIGVLALFFGFAGPGLPERRFLVGAMASLWAFRLAWHLLTDRVLHGEEDGRYQALRHRWGDRFEHRIFWFFQAQGVLAVLFSLPALIAMTGSRAGLGLPDAAAVVIWTVAVVGESIADRQLAAWRSEPANRGTTCRRGLWKTSRHPNYFFEWLHWWAYAAAAIGAAGWWITVLAPLVMLFFILFVTGIPPTEARALESRGEDYRAYQRSTSAFVPWFPKRSKGTGVRERS